MALECEDSGTKIADVVIAEERDNAAELAKYPTHQNDPTILKNPVEPSSTPPTFEAATDTRRVDLIEGDSSRQVIIGTALSPKYESALIEFLRENRDIFAWKPSDMLGVPRELAEHKLHVDPEACPVK
jgi:hypothetical protein